jgi:mannose-1-phosphate guanylyltransferase
MAQLSAQGADHQGVAILTSDQRIGPDEAFFEDVRSALALAEEIDGLAVIGIRPNRPETGFGYIEQGDPAGPGRRVLRFREKPNLETAEEFLASGRFLWNAGMFFWTAAAFRRELGRAQPEMAEAYDRMAAALAAGRDEAAGEAFRSLPKLSIDYALMERAERVGVVEAKFQWDDLGTWEALSRSLAADGQGNVSLGPAMGLEAKGCIIHAPGFEVSLLGVEGIVVVVHEGQVLVMPRERAQDLKKLASDGHPIGAVRPRLVESAG